MKTEAKLIFFNGIEQLLTLVPDELFPSMQARLAQKAAIRSANEELVEQEEREFAAAALRQAAQKGSSKESKPRSSAK